MTDLSAVLDVLAKLGDKRPFTAEAVGKAFAVELNPDFETSTPYFTVYQGGPEGLLTRIEVREPRQADPVKQGMVLVDLGGCATRADVGDRFGAAEPGPPPPLRPGMPADSPAYATYPQAWGAVKLGWSRSNACLLRVILDANR